MTMIKPFSQKDIPKNSRLLIITEMPVREESFLCEFLLDGEKKTLSIHAEPRESHMKMGSLYSGRIERVLSSPAAAFLNLGEGMAYLPIRQGMPLFYTDKRSGKDFCKGQGLSQGDSLLVSVDKEAVRTKEAVLTSRFTVKSSHLIYEFGRKGLHFAKAIRKDQKKEVEELCLTELDPGDWDGSITLRTNAKGVSANVLLPEMRRLLDRVRSLEMRGMSMAGPGLLEEAEPHYIESFLHEEDSYDYIRTDLCEVNEILKEKAMESHRPDLLDRIDYYQDDFSLAKLYSLTKRLEEASQRLVYLKCGGNLVLEKTEACYVIDVNSAKALHEAPFDLNREALIEAFRQIRLRNLSGIILIDLVKMKTEAERQALVDISKDLAEKDPLPVRVYGITALGLLEVTREKRERTLRDQLKI